MQQVSEAVITPRCPSCHRPADGIGIRLKRRVRGRRYFWCERCVREFSDRAGTMMEGSRVSLEQLLRAVLLWHEGLTRRVICLKLDIDKDTVTRLLDVAAANPNEVCGHLRAQHLDPKVVTGIRLELGARQALKAQRRARSRRRTAGART